MPLAYYIIQKDLRGEAAVPELSCSLAYFCRTCGEIWGRIVVEGAETWNLQQVPCAAHQPTGVPDWNRIAGSILLPLDPHVGAWGQAASLALLPAAMLRRELEIHLTHTETLWQNSPQ